MKRPFEFMTPNEVTHSGYVALKRSFSRCDNAFVADNLGKRLRIAPRTVAMIDASYDYGNYQIMVEQYLSGAEDVKAGLPSGDRLATMREVEQLLDEHFADLKYWLISREKIKYVPVVTSWEFTSQKD
jgi:hypothetical protein